MFKPSNPALSHSLLADETEGLTLNGGAPSSSNDVPKRSTDWFRSLKERWTSLVGGGPAPNRASAYALASTNDAPTDTYNDARGLVMGGDAAAPMPQRPASLRSRYAGRPSPGAAGWPPAEEALPDDILAESAALAAALAAPATLGEFTATARASAGLLHEMVDSTRRDASQAADTADIMAEMAEACREQQEQLASLLARDACADEASLGEALAVNELLMTAVEAYWLLMTDPTGEHHPEAAIAAIERSTSRTPASPPAAPAAVVAPPGSGDAASGSPPTPAPPPRSRAEREAEDLAAAIRESLAFEDVRLRTEAHAAAQATAAQRPLIDI